MIDFHIRHRTWLDENMYVTDQSQCRTWYRPKLMYGMQSMPYRILERQVFAFNRIWTGPTDFNWRSLHPLNMSCIGWIV